MGPSSDPLAVVDPTGKVHGLDGLYVCDASIFPTLMRANTNLPAAMVAEHMAAGIGEDSPRPSRGRGVRSVGPHPVAEFPQLGGSLLARLPRA